MSHRLPRAASLWRARVVGDEEVGEAFEAGDAAALDQDGVAGAQGADVVCRDLEVGHLVAGVDTVEGRVHGDDPDAQVVGEASDGPVLVLGDVAQLGHDPEHRHPAVGLEVGQRLQRGPHRLRVGVVGVVDHDGPAGGRMQGHAERRHLRPAQALGGIVE